MARLKKRDVEQLARDYDADPTRALTLALRLVTEMPNVDWVDLVQRLPFNATRRGQLAAGDSVALDALFRDLVELRELPSAADDTGGR